MAVPLLPLSRTLPPPECRTGRPRTAASCRHRNRLCRWRNGTLARHPWLATAMLLVRLGLLAGAAMWLLAMPRPAEALRAFAVVAAALSA